MSRVGKKPVVIPAGVTVEITGADVKVAGPLGKLQRSLGSGVSVELAGGSVVLKATGSDKQSVANFGTSRALIQNMVTGVQKGWKRGLEMTGVGFGAKLNGSELVLSCGFSHEVRVAVPAEVKCTVGKTSIELTSVDKDLVGRLASSIRAVQPPEPYLGKGIRYVEEKVRRKAGKTGKK
jgi:large subunit ribosomal protein L6